MTAAQSPREQKAKIAAEKGGWVALAISVVYYGIQLGVGVYGLNYCSAEPIDLGVWLIVNGATGLGVMILSRIRPVAGIVTCLYAPFFFAWFIVGGVCLFSDPGLSTCHQNADSQLVWGTTLFYWVFSLVAFLVTLCCSCCAATLVGTFLALRDHEEYENIV